MDGGRQKQFKPPAGWTTCRLGELLPLSYGKALRKDRRNPQGDVPVYGSSGVVGSHDEALTSGEALIVGRKGNAGAVYFSDRPCWPIDTAYFAEQTTGLSSRFWYHYLTHLRLGELDQSTAIPSLNRDIYGALVAPVPPANEQLRIASKIDELFSQIDAGEANLKRVQALVKTYRQSILKAAVTGDLTRDWRNRNRGEGETGEALLKRILAARRQAWEDAELAKLRAKGKAPKDDKWKARYQEPAAPDTSSLPKLPEDWTWATLDQLTAPVSRAMQSGPFGSNLKHSEFQESGKLVIGIDNVQDGYFSLGSENRISDQKFEELKKYLARPKDLLVTVMATIGRTCLAPDDVEPAIITKHVYRITLDRELVIPEFAHLCILGSPICRKQMFQNARGQTRPGLNKKILQEIALPLPPTKEQGEIFNLANQLLSTIDPFASDVQKQMKSGDRLRQSVLKAAFGGKLVPHDSSDEPADALLSRLSDSKG